MNEKATIYDFARMCKSYGENCKPCPFYDKECELGDMSNEELQEANEIILKWCKEHPVETRQSKLLKVFSNAKVRYGVPDICPMNIDETIACEFPRCSCAECRKEYWLAEVDENE